MRAYLGVDGGGTKTALCVVSEHGELLASYRAPSCYYLEAANTAGLDLVEQVLGEAVSEVCRQAGVPAGDLDFAFIGLPGYGEVSGDVKALDALPTKVLGHHRYRCDNDMVCGWAGSLGLVDGINVVSGTGSIGYGRRGGRSARVGGWGELIGDEGSGYWIAIQALQACTQMSDGRQPAGPLLALITDELALAAPLDLVDVIHNRWRGDRGRIAALSRVVVDASRAGDPAATAILFAAAAELAQLVRTIRTRLQFPPDEAVPVSYSGGVFAADEVTAEFGRLVGGPGETYELRHPWLSPVLGAAIYAAQLGGHPLSPKALEVLSRH